MYVCVCERARELVNEEILTFFLNQKKKKKIL